MQAPSWLSLAAALFALASPAKAIAQQPFTLHDNLIRVQAKVDGKPVTAVLDSGTSQIILDRATAALLDIAKGAASVPGVGGGAGPQELRPISIKNVNVGPVRLGGIQGFSMDLTPLSTSAGFKIDVILGEPLFESNIIRIDYKKYLVNVFSTTRPMTCHNPLPLSIVAGVPVVTATIRADHAAPPTILHLIVDLGTRHFAALIGGPFLNTRAGQDLVRGGRRTQIGTGTGGKVEGSVAEISELQIGGQTFSALQVALTREVKAFESGAIDGTLEVPLWSGGVITFDYPHRRVCMVPGRGA